jgi:hypothetical protein
MAAPDLCRAWRRRPGSTMALHRTLSPFRTWLPGYQMWTRARTAINSRYSAPREPPEASSTCFPSAQLAHNRTPGSEVIAASRPTSLLVPPSQWPTRWILPTGRHSRRSQPKIDRDLSQSRARRLATRRIQACPGFRPSSRSNACFLIGISALSISVRRFPRERRM